MDESTTLQRITLHTQIVLITLLLRYITRFTNTPCKLIYMCIYKCIIFQRSKIFLQNKKINPKVWNWTLAGNNIFVDNIFIFFKRKIIKKQYIPKEPIIYKWQHYSKLVELNRSMHLERRNHIAAQYASINSGFKKSPHHHISSTTLWVTLYTHTYTNII